LVGNETSRILFGVRSTCRKPDQASGIGRHVELDLRDTEWIQILARSNPRHHRLHAGFTTVAIGVGPFLFSWWF
jgi:hypothetical protein